MSPAAVHRVDTPLQLPHIPYVFDNAHPDESAVHLVQSLFPDWKHDEGTISLKKFTDGITNTLMKATKERPGRSAWENDEDSILIRTYGEGTDALIDRERECRSHNLLATLGLAPPLLARFENGLMYRFIQGDVCTPEDLTRPEIYRAVAKRLGQWHGLLPISAISTPAKCEESNGDKDANSAPIPNLWTVTQSWIDALPATTEKEKQRNAMLDTELKWLVTKLGGTRGLGGKDFVFGHCDLLSGNVIMMGQRPTSYGQEKSNGASEQCVSFIDYEYATPAPAAFDISNHFAEWAGFDCDHNAVPTKSSRRDFLESYVRSFREHSHSSGKSAATNGTAPPVQEASDEDSEVKRDVDEIYAQIDLFRGVPGFYWGIWALIQATISQIDFDYASYAELRLGEYWDWKAELDGSRVREGRKLGTRETRWAQE